MKKELKSKEGAILNETQQIYQLMNIADSLDNIDKTMVKIRDLIDITNDEMEGDYTLKEFLSDNFFYFIMIALIIVILVKP